MNNKIILMPKLIYFGFMLIFLAGCNSIPSNIESMQDNNVKSEKVNDSASAHGKSLVIFPESDCLAREFIEKLPESYNLFDTEIFTDKLFPWFEPDIAPQNEEEFAKLLARPKVISTLDQLNIRYLITFSIDNHEKNKFPGMFCGAGFGAAGCLGFALNEGAHEVTASVWDLNREGDMVSSIKTKATGKRYALGLIIPLFFWADTQQDACEEAARLIIEGMFSP